MESTDSKIYCLCHAAKMTVLEPWIFIVTNSCCSEGRWTFTELGTCRVSSCYYHLSCPQVNTNGVLSFDRRFNQFEPWPFPISTLRLISPYWENFETARFGHVYYRNTTEHALLWRAQFYLQDIFPSARNYFPTYLILATWDEIPEFGIRVPCSFFHCPWIKHLPL